MLKKSIQEEKNHPRHELADAFICVVMSHGSKRGTIRTSDWEELNINEDIVAPFDNENWRMMTGKPKIFLFQMCRGGKSHACAIDMVIIVIMIMVMVVAYFLFQGLRPSSTSPSF